MAVSALQASNSVPAFEDPYSYSLDTSIQNAYKSQGLGDFGAAYDGTSGLPGIFRKLFGEDVDTKKSLAQKVSDQEYERASINSARAWSKYMDDTQFQRRVEDLKKAGLNPWLAVQNGISGSGSPTVDTGGSAKNQTKSDQSMSALATLIMAIAKIFA